ncbi:MobH family relaxase [Massilia sp. YIM B04103]|uniref:MobH family relaxase n=1 Tax=Massilia sp. YIM B04103 TaxID=2963106 RepID=UPI00210A61E3|nr:MobH family relaxase [Massilia sp. YIM B04103]
MLLSRLFACLLRPAGSAAAQDDAVATPFAAQQAERDDGAGIAARSVASMLEDNADLIGRIKLCYGSDPATFAADLLEPVRAYLAFVNALPATPDGYFREAGGLARLGLETAFYALQATDAQIFAGRLTISNRRRLEPRWRRATFLAGLCCELHRALSQVQVHGDGGARWQPYAMPLTCWLQQHKAARFRTQWVPAQETRALGLFALPMIVPPAMIGDLAAGNTVIVPHLLASVAGAAMYQEHNVMDRLVRHAAVLVINRNLRAQGDGNGLRKPPVYLVRHVIDVVRELVVTHQGWQPNTGRSRLWFGLDGLFMVWPNGLADVIRRLEDERLPGVPQTPEAMLDTLVAAGVVADREGQPAVQAIWPPGSLAPLEAVRFVSAGSILAILSPLPEPLDCHLAGTARRHDPAGSSEERPAAPQADEGDSCPPPSIPPDAQQAHEAGGRQLSLPTIEQSPLPEEGRGAAGTAQANAGDVAPARKPRRVKQQGAAGAPPALNGLTMPLRLNPAVARAVEAIVQTLGGAGAPACHRMAEGVFIPLSELAARGIDARQAQRALMDAGMLAPQADGELIQTRAIGDFKRPGLFVAPHFFPDATTPAGAGQ